MTAGNSSVTTYGYDTLLRTTDVWHKTSGNVTLGRYQYSYDGASNVASRTDNDGSVTSFGYDNANQLTSETRSAPSAYTATYTYDNNGNRLTKTLGGVTENYSYDSHDHLTAAGGKTYAYDANGNCTSVTQNNLTTSLSYTYDNRISQITYSGGSTNTFQYNGLGLRVQKVDSSGTRNYVCEGASVASTVLSDGSAVYSDGSERRSGASSFRHTDALGSTRGITNASQAATDGLLLDAFGMTVSRTGSTPTPFGFVGSQQYQTDADSGLMLLGHRYYDPSIGRFITSDPAQDGTNWYAYCGNDPLGGTDPEGLNRHVSPPGGGHSRGRVHNKTTEWQYALVKADGGGFDVRPYLPGDPTGPGGKKPPIVIEPGPGKKPVPAWPVHPKPIIGKTPEYFLVPVAPGARIDDPNVDVDAGWDPTPGEEGWHKTPGIGWGFNGWGNWDVIPDHWGIWPSPGERFNPAYPSPDYPDKFFTPGFPGPKEILR